FLAFAVFVFVVFLWATLVGCVFPDVAAGSAAAAVPARIATSPSEWTIERTNVRSMDSLGTASCAAGQHPRFRSAPRPHRISAGWGFFGRHRAVTSQVRIRAPRLASYTVVRCPATDDPPLSRNKRRKSMRFVTKRGHFSS